MARLSRMEFPGALYHVTSRGNAGKSIFDGWGSREHFLTILELAVKRCNLLIHAYCLMDNHYHLLVETPEGNLSSGMRLINGVYAQSFNIHNGTYGHLFQGRYKSLIVDKDDYLLGLARYIVLNPVRAGLARDPSRWRWSSYQATAGIVECPPFLAVDWILAQFGKERRKAQNRYREFVLDGIGQGVWKELHEKEILGKEPFVRKIESRMTEDSLIEDVHRNQMLKARPPLEKLFSTSVGPDERNRRIVVAYIHYGYSQREIARHLGISNSTASRTIGRMSDTDEPI